MSSSFAGATSECYRWSTGVARDGRLCQGPALSGLFDGLDKTNWPVLFFILALLLLDPLRKLIGRIKIAKAPGINLEFHDAMEAIDDLTERVLEDVSSEQSAHQRETAMQQPQMTDPSADDSAKAPLSRPEWATQPSEESPAGVAAESRLRDLLAVRDPSGTVIAAWEHLFAELFALNEKTRGRGDQRASPIWSYSKSVACRTFLHLLSRRWKACGVFAMMWPMARWSPRQEWPLHTDNERRRWPTLPGPSRAGIRAAPEAKRPSRGCIQPFKPAAAWCRVSPSRG